MGDELANIPSEGSPVFPSVEKEDTTSSDSQSDNKGTDKVIATDDLKNKQPDDQVPFNEHPRWKEREDKWNTRYNEQETRHVQAIEDLRKEFVTAKKERAVENSEVPDWFGGDEKSWASYVAYEEAKIKKAEENAIARLKTEQEQTSKRQEESNKFFQDEVSFIEADKTLNPNSQKVDQNKLLKIVMDNDIVDSKGNWNWRAGWRLLQNSQSNTSTKDRKAFAGATTSDTKADETTTPYKTAADFKKNKPW